jgi:hypothetical protein
MGKVVFLYRLMFKCCWILPHVHICSGSSMYVPVGPRARALMMQYMFTLLLQIMYNLEKVYSIIGEIIAQGHVVESVPARAVHLAGIMDRIGRT